MTFYGNGRRARKRNDCYDFSRPLAPGERIDFFVSHSWSDDSALKWTSLSQLAENFRLKHARYPTFWIDKFCLLGSDGDPTEELRGLCVNICACNRLVALCGMTFPSRLWCAWEVFVMTAFQHKSEAIARVELILLISDDDVDVREAFRIFDVATTKCYSPMDQHRLMRIIDAVGRSDFNDKIRKMAKVPLETTKAQKPPQHSSPKASSHQRTGIHT
uniref:TIR domain-containing protein n=1 Tax=Octactis speculum TaxID=3111310 RepID=A0A7S2BVQ7_9STRA|mmetsp:Transcript_28030/g.38406  ORF Transcript_28030/g.38406 Transcript_28030/m.38406 type:complete len:217 (+) Transcript_28030:88-738(+)